MSEDVKGVNNPNAGHLESRQQKKSDVPWLGRPGCRRMSKGVNSPNAGPLESRKQKKTEVPRLGRQGCLRVSKGLRAQTLVL